MHTELVTIFSEVALRGAYELPRTRSRKLRDLRVIALLLERGYLTRDVGPGLPPETLREIATRTNPELRLRLTPLVRSFLRRRRR